MRPIAGPVLALTQVATSYLASGFQALPGGTGVLTPLLWVSPSSLGHLHTSPTVSAAPLGTREAPRGREVVRGSSSRVYLLSPHQSPASARGGGASALKWRRGQWCRCPSHILSETPTDSDRARLDLHLQLSGSREHPAAAWGGPAARTPRSSCRVGPRGTTPAPWPLGRPALPPALPCTPETPGGLG